MYNSLIVFFVHSEYPTTGRTRGRGTSKVVAALQFTSYGINIKKTRNDSTF